MTETDWSEWHDAYARPDSGLRDRLAAVRAQISRRLEVTAPGPVRVVSACSGDGRDLLGVLDRRSDADRVTPSSWSTTPGWPPAPVKPPRPRLRGSR